MCTHQNNPSPDSDLPPPRQFLALVLLLSGITRGGWGRSRHSLPADHTWTRKMLLSSLEELQAASLISHNSLALASPVMRAARAPHRSKGTGLLEAKTAHRQALSCTLSQAMWPWVTRSTCDMDVLKRHGSTMHGHLHIWYLQLPNSNGHTRVREHLVGGSSCVHVPRPTHSPVSLYIAICGPRKHRPWEGVASLRAKRVKAKSALPPVLPLCCE